MALLATSHQILSLPCFELQIFLGIYLSIQDYECAYMMRYSKARLNAQQT